MSALSEQIRFVAQDTLPQLKETEMMARHAYSLIGPEYYDDRHVTCRNFDQTIDAYLRNHPLELKAGCRYLEVGCGRSRLARFGRADVQTLVLDVAQAMLAHTFRQGRKTSFPLLGSAFALPFRNSAFTGSVAFLADPYLCGAYFAELHRTLEPRGRILQVVPAYEWGVPLRAHRQSPIHLAHFFRGDREAFCPSFLLPKSDLVHFIAGAGFYDIRFTDLCLPRTVQYHRISSDIVEPAKSVGVSAYDLPILTVVEALR